MTGAGAVGLMAIFLVDLLSLLYVSRLGDAQLTAAVGFATQVMFVTVSVNIGLAIGVTALVSRALGRGEREGARRLAGSALAHVALASGLVVAAIWLSRGAILGWLGASGEAGRVAERFLAIALPANVMLGLGMAMSGVLRAVGDARRAMYVTLAGGAVTAALDPLLIFGAGLGVDGAAIATVASRVAFVVVGWHGAGRVHRLIGRPTLREMREDAGALYAIAAPAILTNIASPVASSWIMGVFAGFGPAAVAAFAIMDRVSALGYGPVFALSGSVGAILGQNLGARRFDRVSETMTICFALAAGYAALVGVVIAIAAPWIAAAFGAPPEAAALIPHFALWGAAAWMALSLLFVANAGFNNLGAPLLATAFNWGRATLGVIPFATLGGRLGGATGAMMGIAAGSLVFGLGSFAASRFVTRRLAKRAASA
ncbi:MAG: MATE family efflux transporter [Rhizobiales bacterium]|nr:MATE family efflux transporter [Hyphomicrobiales bacterium]